MSALRWVSVLALGALFGCEAEIPDGRFLWEVCDELSDLTELFPAYYVWWLSFFVTGVGILRIPARPA